LSSAATWLVVTSQPPSSVRAGDGFGLSVAAEDNYGNLDTNFNGSVTVAQVGSAGGVLGGTLTVTAANGVATFSGLTLARGAALCTLQVSSPGLTGVTPLPIAVFATTAVKLSVSSATPQAWQAVTFTATVGSSSAGALVPTGTVTFLDGATVLGKITLDARGRATFTTTTLTAGSHSITAVYDSNGGLFNGSASAALTVRVAPAPSPSETSALHYLTMAWTMAYGDYFYGSHSTYAYNAYLNAHAAYVYAQIAYRTHNAQQWSLVMQYARLAQNYAHQDCVAHPSSYASNAYVYAGQGYAFAHNAYRDYTTS
jgi:hypothetical protein